MAADRDDQIPADQQVTREIPTDQPQVGETVPDDAQATVSAAPGVGAPRRRDRWRRAVRPTSRRGRGLLAGLAAVVLLLVGGAAGFAIGHADGGRGDGGYAVQDGGRGDGGGRGDRDEDGGRGNRDGDRDGDDSATTSPSTSTSSSSAAPTT